MKKTLLIAVAALAAGIVSTQAQAVYSQNIVGYVNLSVAPNGFSLLSNPLDTYNASGAIDNSATNVFVNKWDPVNGGPLDGSSLLIWNGGGYDSYYFDSNPADTTTGFTDFSGAPVACPILSPGLGFYFNNQTTTNAIQVTGAVRGSTSTGLFITNTVGKVLNFYLVGSPLPIAGDLVTNLQFKNVWDPINGGPLDGCEIQVPIYTAGHGNISGYNTYYFDSNPADTSTGFTDFSGAPVAAPQVTVGQGFFFSNQTPGNYPWVQNVIF